MKKILLTLICLAALPIAAIAATDSHKKAAEELLIVTNAEKTMERVYPQMETMFKNIIKQSNIPAENVEIAERYLQRIMELVMDEISWEKLKPQLIEIYLEVYSESELNEIVAFYKSPTGQKFIAKMPELMTATMKINQTNLQRIMPKIQAMSEEMMVEVRQQKDNCGQSQGKSANTDPAVQILC